MNSDLLKGLNDKQIEAVQYTEGPLLVLAGAGSGKTRVLTHRVGYLIEQGLARPWQILAITFTNKAAGEMKERVERLLPGTGQEVFVSTFHSMCVRMLRRDIDRLGYNRDFTIYDTDDQKTLMRHILKDLAMDPKIYRESSMLAWISSQKNEMSDASECENNARDFHDRNKAKIYAEYEKRLLNNNALDFDDLLNKTVELFLEFPEVLESWQNRFLYIMVDEYQDTNRTQFELVRLLSSKYQNLCVVGDDDQSIYKFRGADIGNILSFEKTFPTAKVIKLEQNYRSTGAILNAANEVIAHNKGRKAKTLWTRNEQGKLPVFQEYDTAGLEAHAVIRSVKESTLRLNQQAVLYRTNAQSRLLEEKCIEQNIPYILVGGVNFYQRKEIKDILSYLRLIANGVDDLATERIINVPKRGIGDTTLEKIRSYAALNGISLYDAMCIAKEIPDLSKAIAGKIDRFTDLIESFRNKLTDGNFDLKDLIEHVREQSGYREEIEKEDPTTAQTRLENIEELISKAVEFQQRKEAESKIAESLGNGSFSDSNECLSEFLEEVSLISDLDRKDDSADVLTMMTLHGAKGLEFDKVYITGMEEGLFPSFNSMLSPDSEEDIEEERRLCYVGMTRARKELMMSSARERMINGKTRYSEPSRFISELPLDGVEMKLKKMNSFHSYDEPDFSSRFKDSFRSNWNSYQTDPADFSYRNTPADSAPKPVSHEKNDAFRKVSAIEKVKPDYMAGDAVKHVKFGKGKVTEITEEERDYKVTVDFDEYGTKVLLAGFARLEKC